ncbi:MAG TPA: BlaI/MecI/CopY family transcriptional regulator [Pyrinomonadaceae bacterium]|jgi:Predicted transcriptional regulator|nr:BlaI/MecI/CopY family transcriptional regulator [Pyrinomonadaceae bacterium]
MRYDKKHIEHLSPKKLVDTFEARLYTPKNLGDETFMARSKTENLTPLELEIMHVLWETGPANVMTVQQKLKRELAYTTVQTMLNILHKKGKAKRTLKDRAYFYKPAVSRKQVVSKHVIDVVDRLFGGSAESLVMSLLETKHLTPAKLARLQKLIAEVEEKVDEKQ